MVYKLRIFLTIKCGQNILLAYLWKHAFSWIIDVLFNWNFVNDQVFNLQCLVSWKEIFFTYCNQNKTKEYDPQRVIIICSKFDCSKNLLDTILLLLDTIQAIIIFFVNCSKIKNYEKSSAVRVFRAVSLLDKKILTAWIAIGRQRFWKMSTARHNL